MPINKNAYIRYRIIDSCLRKRKGYFPTKKELIEACSGLGTVSSRTLDNDIYAMKFDEELAYFAPIEYHTRNKGYYYTDPDYSINKIPLKQEDLYAMEFACSILKPFEGIEAVKQFMDSVSKIEDFISMRRTWGNTEWSRFIQAERSLSTKGNEFLSPLLKHIKEQTAVLLHYQRYGEQQHTIHTFNPYVLKEYRNRWYVTGWSETRNKILTFALERIKELIPLNQHFSLQNQFDPESYFRHSFGISVMNDYEPVRVVLSFSPSEAPYIKSQPLHLTQQILEDSPTALVIALQVIPSYELKAEIFRYGNRVKILEPDSLKEEHITTLQAALNQYQ